MKKFQLVIAAALLAAGCAPMRKMTTQFKDPLTAPEHVQLAATYEVQGETEAAEREYRAATKSDRRNFAAQMGLGNTAFELGHYKEAELAFLRALGISKNSAAASNNLAMLYASQGRKLSKAEQLAKRAADDARFRPYALDTLATIYLKQGRVEDARRAVQQARAIAPADDPHFMSNLERTALAAGEEPALPAAE